MWKTFQKLIAEGQIVDEVFPKNKQELIFDPRKFVVVKEHAKSY